MYCQDAPLNKVLEILRFGEKKFHNSASLVRDIIYYIIQDVLFLAANWTNLQSLVCRNHFPWRKEKCIRVITHCSEKSLYMHPSIQLVLTINVNSHLVYVIIILKGNYQFYYYCILRQNLSV